MSTPFDDSPSHSKDLAMSIDAFSGRNPSYCFVDLHTQEDANLAMRNMQGQLVRDRPVRIDHNTERRRSSKPFNQRPDSAVLKRLNTLRYSNEALSHWTAPTMENRRLYVGGLPQIAHQRTLNAEMAGLFNGYDIQAVSKLVWPHGSKAMEPGSHFYAFVDLATAEEAADAVSTLNGMPTPHRGTYRISCSQRNNGSAIVHREQLQGTSRISEGRVFVGGLPELEDVEGNMRTIFAGHDVRSVGHLITPTASRQIGQHYFYCFVDFDSASEAQAVVTAFEGNEMGLTVGLAKAPGRDVGGKQVTSPSEVVRRDFSKSWRRQDVSGVA